MSWKHTKGKRVPPKNLRMYKSRKSCANCGLLDQIAFDDSINNYVCLVYPFQCRRPSGPKYRDEQSADQYICNGHNSLPPDNPDDRSRYYNRNMPEVDI